MRRRGAAEGIARATDLRALSLEECGQLLDLCRPSVRQLIRDGRLRVVKVGRRLLVPAVSVQALLGNSPSRRGRAPQSRPAR